VEGARIPVYNPPIIVNPECGVRGFLNLEENNSAKEGMNGSGSHAHQVAFFDRHTPQDGLYPAGFKKCPELVECGAFLKTPVKRAIWFGVEHNPGLILAVVFGKIPAAVFGAGMDLNAQVLARVEQFYQKGKTIGVFPGMADEVTFPDADNLREGLAREGSVGDKRRAFGDVRGFPGLANFLSGRQGFSEKSFKGSPPPWSGLEQGPAFEGVESEIGHGGAPATVRS